MHYFKSSSTFKIKNIGTTNTKKQNLCSLSVFLAFKKTESKFELNFHLLVFFSYRLMKYLITNKNTTKLQINVKHWTNFFLLILFWNHPFFFFFFTKKIPKYFFSKVQSFRIFCSSVQNNNMVFHSVCIIFRSSSFWAIIERRQEETSRKGRKNLDFWPSFMAFQKTNHRWPLLRPFDMGGPSPSESAGKVT